MITCIREIRHARGMTLDDVARRCDPPTTAQTIGRLETGTRTVSTRWLARIADALGVAPSDLVRLPDRPALPVVALLNGDGADAPRMAMNLVPPLPAPGSVGIRIIAATGDYRAGDELWCERLAPVDFGRALNRDVLLPQPAGRFAFGRLGSIANDRVTLHRPVTGQDPLQLAIPAWLALPVRLIRPL